MTSTAVIEIPLLAHRIYHGLPVITRKACLCVNKSWHTAFLPLLYETVVISQLKKNVGMNAVLHGIKLHGHLIRELSLVKTFEVPEGPTPEQLLEMLTLLETLTKHCHQLLKLKVKVTVSTHWPLLKALLHSNPHLNELEYEEVTTMEVGRSLPELFIHASKLEKLIFGPNDGITIGDLLKIGQYAPRLSQLYVKRCIWPDKEDLPSDEALERDVLAKGARKENEEASLPQTTDNTDNQLDLGQIHISDDHHHPSDSHPENNNGPSSSTAPPPPPPTTTTTTTTTTATTVTATHTSPSSSGHHRANSLGTPIFPNLKYFRSTQPTESSAPLVKVIRQSPNLEVLRLYIGEWFKLAPVVQVLGADRRCPYLTTIEFDGSLQSAEADLVRLIRGLPPLRAIKLHAIEATLPFLRALIERHASELKRLELLELKQCSDEGVHELLVRLTKLEQFMVHPPPRGFSSPPQALDARVLLASPWGCKNLEWLYLPMGWPIDASLSQDAKQTIQDDEPFIALERQFYKQLSEIPRLWWLLPDGDSTTSIGFSWTLARGLGQTSTLTSLRYLSRFQSQGYGEAEKAWIEANWTSMKKYN